MNTTYSFEAVVNKIHGITKLGSIGTRYRNREGLILILGSTPIATIEEKAGKKVKIEMKTRDENAIKAAKGVGKLFEKYGFVASLNVN